MSDDEATAAMALEDLERTMILTDENERLQERVLQLEMDVLSLMKTIHALAGAVDTALDVATQKTNGEQEYVPAKGLRDPAIG